MLRARVKEFRDILAGRLKVFRSVAAAVEVLPPPFWYCAAHIFQELQGFSVLKISIGFNS